jgi:hypothetical protein
VIKDLVVDRSAFDRIIQAGGYITAPTCSVPDANAILIRAAFRRRHEPLRVTGAPRHAAHEDV